VEVAVNDQPPGGSTHRHRPAADDDDPTDDFIPTAHKLDFPKFDGTGDLLPWINCCERYFRVRNTPEHKRVAYATFHLLEDAQLWFDHLELNGGQPMWNRFTQLINACFVPPLMDDPIRELALLRLTGSIDEYYSRFCHRDQCGIVAIGPGSKTLPMLLLSPAEIADRRALQGTLLPLQ
jgi:hypothetical protein